MTSDEEILKEVFTEFGIHQENTTRRCHIPYCDLSEMIKKAIKLAREDEAKKLKELKESRDGWKEARERLDLIYDEKMKKRKQDELEFLKSLTNEVGIVVVIKERIKSLETSEETK